MNVAQSYLDAFARAAQRDPGRVAIVDVQGRETTFAALHRQTAVLARWLKVRGLRPGHRVLLQVPAGPTLAAVTVAVLAGGGVPVIVDPGLGDAVYRGRVKAAAPRMVIVHPVVEAIGRVGAVRRALGRRDISVPVVFKPTPRTRLVRLSGHLLTLLAQLPGPAAAPRHLSVIARRSTDEAVLVFTGGTTSAPKGVQLNHGSLDAYLGAIGALVDAWPTFDSLLADTPQQMLYALRLGKTVYLAPARKALRAAFAARKMATGQVQAYFGSPWVWQQMLSAGHAATLPSTLKCVLLGAAPVTRPFLGRLTKLLDPSTHIQILYGLTEAGPICGVDGRLKLAWSGEGDLVGAPLPGVVVRLESGDSDGEGEGDSSSDSGGDRRFEGVGEVSVHSPGLFSGYLGVAPRRADAPFRTGDLGRWIAPTGTGGAPMLALMGRKKDMILRRAVNLYPPSFEATVLALVDASGAPWITATAMVGVWNEALSDEEVWLFVVPTTGGWDRARQAAFAAQVGDALGPQAAPDRVVALNTLPITGRQNKIDKAALTRRAREMRLETP